MLARMHELARANRSFAIETTCAGRGHARFLRHHQTKGWRITLLFLWLDFPEIALRRVAQRVAAGGHHIPPDTIRRRYHAGLRNLLTLYLPMADTAQIHDNSDGALTLMAQKSTKTGLVIYNADRWTRLEAAAHEADDRTTNP
jgi:predicted ABC-type ATPase